jgi:hypothetical protein
MVWIMKLLPSTEQRAVCHADSIEKLSSRLVCLIDKGFYGHLSVEIYEDFNGKRGILHYFDAKSVQYGLVRVIDHFCETVTDYKVDTVVTPVKVVSTAPDCGQLAVYKNNHQILEKSVADS